MRLLLFIWMALIGSVEAGSAQTALFNFDSDAAGGPPSGFTSYAAGGGPAGRWLVVEVSDAPSGKHAVSRPMRIAPIRATLS